jgi:hypothetical protein
MPAINPTQLEKQITAALSAKDDPQLCVRRLYEILEFYADRTRRSVKASDTLILGKVLRVPRPVLQAITRSIHAEPDYPGGLRLESSSMLWEMNSRETRMVAVSLLSGVEPPLVMARFEDWAADCDDEEVLHWMAGEGLKLSSRPHEDIPWKGLNGWLRHPAATVQQLALFSLLELVEGSPRDGHLPRVFRLLRSVPGSMSKASYLALQDLMWALAGRSPQESAQYLLDELKSSPEARRLIEKTLGAFPQKLQEELRQVL